MCFVLDANSFHCFFNPCHEGYIDFKPLHDWLYKERGTKLVCGGSKNLEEIDQLKKYRPYLVELKKKVKFVKIDSKLVDGEEERLKAKIDNKACDDAHLVALLAVSGCILFASHDKRADKFIKRKDLYPKDTPRRKIYRSRDQSASLLTKENIVELHNVVS